MKIITLFLLLLNLPYLLFSQNTYNHEDWKQVQNFYPKVSMINCIDSINCYIPMNVANNLTIYKSSDVGRTWNLLYDKDIYFFGYEYSLNRSDDFPIYRNNPFHQTTCPHYYFVSCRASVIYTDAIKRLNGTSNILKSSDGAITFEFINSDSLLNIQHKPPFGITELFMLDSLVGLRFFADSFFVKTHLPQNSIIELGSKKSLLVTFDGGYTYERREFPSAHIRDKVFNIRYDMASPTHLNPLFSQINSREMIYLTTDELYHYNINTDEWTKIGNGLPKCISCIDSYNLYKDTMSCIYDDMKFVNKNIGYIIIRPNGIMSNDGTIKYELDSPQKDRIYKTTDSGITWNKVLDTMLIPILNIEYSNLTRTQARIKLSFFDEYNGLTYLYGGMSSGQQHNFEMLKTNASNDGFNTCEIPMYKYVNVSSIRHALQGGNNTEMAWAGRTPLFVTSFGHQVFRYEGDFFKFGIAKLAEDVFPPDSSIAHKTYMDFDWTLNEEAESFIFQLSREPDFSDLITSKTIEIPTISMDILEYFKEYYWRVATQRCGYTKWSEIFTFRTRMPDISTLAPDCNAVEQPKDITLQWTSVKGAEQYRIRLATDSAFENILLETDGIIETEYPLTNLDNSKTYYWQVQASRSDERGDWSDVCSFTIESGVGVNELEHSNFISIEQSKTHIKFNINNENIPSKEIVISIYSLNGTLLNELNSQLSTGQNTYEINISSYPSGTYIFTIKGDGMVLESNKFIIVK